MSNLNTASVKNIIAVGSVDGVLTAAAVKRLYPEASVFFTQAFTVDKFDVSPIEGNVLLVDLAVNNKDAEMTVNFVNRLLLQGIDIVGVCDEHDAAAWNEVFEATGINPADLIVQPCSQREGGYESSGALFAATFGDELDAYGKTLCQQADEADHMNFGGEYAAMVNQAVKSKIWDNSRRVHLIEVLSQSQQADDKILGWIDEYKAILETHKDIISSREELGYGIVRLDCLNKVIDMTTLMKEVYDLEGTRVVIVVGESFNPMLKRKMVQHSFGTKDKSLDLLAAVQEAGIEGGGFAQKVNVLPENADAALAAIQQLLS